MIKQPSSPVIEVGSVQKEGKKERPGIQNALILEDFKIPFFVFFRLSERGFLGRKFSLDFDPAALLGASV